MQAYNQQLLLFGGDFASGKAASFCEVSWLMISIFRSWRFLPFAVHSTGRATGAVVEWSLVTGCWRWHRRCSVDSSFRTNRLRDSSKLCIQDQLKKVPHTIFDGSGVRAVTQQYQQRRRSSIRGSPSSSSDGSVTSQSCGRLHAVHYNNLPP